MHAAVEACSDFSNLYRKAKSNNTHLTSFVTNKLYHRIKLVGMHAYSLAFRVEKNGGEETIS